MKEKITIIGIGGSLEPESSTLLYLKKVLIELDSLGAATKLVDIKELSIPLYDYSKGIENAGADFKKLLNDIHTANGLVLASPEYHGTVSSSFKNVVDYFEFLSVYNPPYLTGKPVGCIAIAGAENAGELTLSTMINIVHSLRGIAASGSLAIGSAYKHINEGGEIINESILRKLKRLAEEVYTLSNKLK